MDKNIKKERVIIYKMRNIPEVDASLANDAPSVHTIHKEFSLDALGGSIRKYCYYNKDGFLTNMYKEWHKNNTLKIMCNYRDGHFIDEYTRWDKNYQVKQHIQYDNDGKVLYYYKDHKKVVSMNK